jgi:hypothetical protein
MKQTFFTALSKSELVLVLDDLVLKYIYPYHLVSEENLDIQFPMDYADSIHNLIQEMREDLAYALEFPYTDKLFRDSYTHFYSRQHNPIDRDCIRVSVFKKNSEKFKIKTVEYLLDNNEYLGFFVVRPTQPISCGRSFLNPMAFNKNNFISCLVENKSHILGRELSTSGFHHSTQDGTVHSCAETAIWILMEYFGNKYPFYGTILPSEIHKIQRKVTFERQLPSKGMGIDQITFTLRKLGFGSLYYTADVFKDFKHLVNDYVESGIPIILFTGVENKGSLENAHVVILTGHDIPKTGKYIPELKNPEEVNVLNSKKKVVSSFKIIDSADCFPNRNYVAFDDNKPPYRFIDLLKPLKEYSDKEMKKSISVAIVVPLYPKIYLDAFQVRNLFKTIIKMQSHGPTCFKEDEVVISRFLLTSSKSYKNWLKKKCESNVELTDLLTLPMPKFVWLVELLKSTDYANGLVSGFMIFDSTATQFDDIDNYLMAAYYPDKILMKNDEEVLKANAEKRLLSTISLYENNLKTFN